MGIFPKLILLKGTIINDPRLIELIRNHDALSGLELCRFFIEIGMDIANKQLLTFGEGNISNYMIVILNNLDVHTSLTGHGDDNNHHAEIMIDFFS